MQFSGITMTGGFSVAPIAAPVVPTDPYWANVSFLSETTSTNGQTNNVFLDSSSSPKTLTNTGTPTQGTFSPFTLSSGSSYSPSVNGGSGLFSGGQLSFTQQSISGDFTAECWFYRTGNAAGYSIIFGGNALSGGADNCQLYVRNDGSVVMGLNAGVTCSSAASTVTTGAWYHIVWVKSGTSAAIFVNGTRVATATTSANLIYQVISGAGGVAGNYYAQGYLSSCRVVSAAVYDPANSTITVPTTPLTAIANTNLLCNFTNAGMYDATTKNNLLGLGDTKVSTTQSKFAPTSVAFDGTGDYLTAPDNTALQMGTSDFTIEFWIYYNNITGYQTPFDKGYSGVGGLLFQTGNGTGRLVIYVSGTTVITEAGTGSSGTWIHYALVRSGTALTLYRDGVSVGTATNSTNINNTSQLALGANGTALGSGPGNYPLNGYMQDVRITKGVARYTANFTPPAAAFPTN